LCTVVVKVEGDLVGNREGAGITLFNQLAKNDGSHGVFIEEDNAFSNGEVIGGRDFLKEFQDKFKNLKRNTVS
jgi:hypothetical protein